MKGIIIISSVLVLLIALAIGAGIWLFLQFKPNARFFLLDNIRLGAGFDGKQARYRFIEVGNPVQPYCGTLGLSFRCGDTEVYFDQMTEEQLFQMATLVKSANHESISGGSWPDHAKRLIFCNWAVEVVVSEGVVLQVKAHQRWDTRHRIREQSWLQIRTDRSSTWISVPFSESDAVRLFGTPDRTTDTFIH